MKTLSSTGALWRLILRANPLHRVAARRNRSALQAATDPFERAASAAWILYALAPLITYCSPVYFGLLSAHNGLSETQVGLLAGAESIGAVVASLGAKWWITRLNWRHTAAVSLIIMVAGILATVVVTSFVGLLAVRTATSVFGGGPLLVIAITVLSGTRLPDRNFAFAFAAQLLIGMFVLLLLPFADAEAGWWGVAGGLSICFAALIPATSRLPIGAKLTDEMTPTNGAVRLSTGSWLLLLSIGLLSASTQGSWAFSEILGRAAGMPLNKTSLLLVGSSILAVVGSLAAAPMATAWGRGRSYFAGSVITLLCLVPLYVDLGVAAYVQYYLIGAFMTAFIAPFQLGALSDRHDGTAAATLTPAVQAAGMMLGPMLVGLTATTYGPLSSVSLAGACLLSAALAYASGSRSQAITST